MTKNPFYNSGIALLYIVTIVSLLKVGSLLFSEQKDNILMPMGALSLFVLSAAIMAYIFLYQPIIMFLDGKRKEGVHLFLSTVGIFAVITFVVLLSSVTVFQL